MRKSHSSLISAIGLNEVSKDAAAGSRHLSLAYAHVLGERRSGCSKRRGLMAPVIRLSLEGSQQKGEKRMSRKWSPVPALTATDKPRMNPENNLLHMAVRSHGRLLRNRL